MVNKNNCTKPPLKMVQKNNSGKRRLSMKIKLKIEKRIGIGLKCMFIAKFFMVSSQKKNQTNNFNSFGAREGGKKCLKKVKKMKKKKIFLR